MEVKHKCTNCGKEFELGKVPLNSLTGIPFVSIESDKAICGECDKDGWSFCKVCGMLYNKNETDYSMFYIYKDISDAPQKFQYILDISILDGVKRTNYIDEKQYCSNKDYNLYFWEDNIVMMVNKLISSRINGYNDLIRQPLGSEATKKITDEEIEELSEYVGKKIEYIKNNL